MSQADTEVPEWTLGWRLQRALAHAGISVEDMAAELGVTRQTVGRWMHGRVEPKSGFLKLWALRCGVPYEWLAEGIRKRGINPPPVGDLAGKIATNALTRLAVAA